MSDKLLTEDDLANMSDDEVMGMATPPVMAPVEAEEPKKEEAAVEQPKAEAQPADASGSPTVDEDPEDEAILAGKGKDGDAGGKGEARAEPEPTAPAAKDDTKADPTPDKTQEPAKAEESKGQTPEELKAFYDQIMGPIRANGKEIQLRSPDEAVRLIQMGANYTKKLQALQPALKVVKMLENNGLMDEARLSYLIDLDKKNPAAIQKLIKESGIDPLEIDTAAKTTYTPGNHTVSDQEVAFQSAVDDLMMDQAGKETLVLLNKTFDGPSKSAVMKEPGLLQVIHEQRQNGIYETISTELERRRMLGLINASQSYLQNYLSVGKELDAQGLLVSNKAPAKQISRVVDTRPASPPPKPVTINDEKAKAASPVNATPQKKATQDFNPLAMSDEEFEKTASLAARL